jgi:hypothetical protein
MGAAHKTYLDQRPRQLPVRKVLPTALGARSRMPLARLGIELPTTNLIRPSRILAWTRTSPKKK